MITELDLLIGRELIIPVCPNCESTLLEIQHKTWCEWCGCFVHVSGKRKYYQKD